MESRASQIKEFILFNVGNNPSGIAKMTADKFGVTSMTVHRHLTTLTKQGFLTKIGSTRNTKYFLQQGYNKTQAYNLLVPEDKIFADFSNVFKDLPKNIYDICYFCVTEMLNNAIDHSKGDSVTLSTRLNNQNLMIEITDNGVGAFKTISENLHIEDLRECILHLSKGKVTRDPVNHTGQGIFFTSRAMDTFSINANGYIYTRNNFLHDWTLGSLHSGKGTIINMRINIETGKILREVFSRYENDNLAFDSTEVSVHLADWGESDFISRSQAKRILVGLEKFSIITLDFQKINEVGQGFVDEIFRVFRNRYPNIHVRFINANDNITFMIEIFNRRK